MIDLIMLCGQGSVGKSTYAKSNYPEQSIVSVDAIVGRDKYNSSYEKLYIDAIQQKLDAKEKTIVLDFSHDGIISRKTVLSQLNIPNNVNFTTISLRPGAEQIIYNQEKRQKYSLTKSEKKKIIKVYNNFTYPTEEEFKDYGFCKITNLVVNNSYPKEDLNLKDNVFLIKDKQFINELEALHYECYSYQSLISFMLENNENIINNKNFKLYQKEYRDVYKKYNEKKIELENKFIKPNMKKIKNWNLDFKTGELTIYD